MQSHPPKEGAKMESKASPSHLLLCTLLNDPQRASVAQGMGHAEGAGNPVHCRATSCGTWLKGLRRTLGTDGRAGEQEGARSSAHIKWCFWGLPRITGENVRDTG